MNAPVALRDERACGAMKRQVAADERACGA
jgi:hypothetical protein